MRNLEKLKQGELEIWGILEKSSLLSDFWTILEEGKSRESVHFERNDVSKHGNTKKVEKVFSKATTRWTQTIKADGEDNVL